MEIYIEFAKWLDNVLSENLPENIVAFNFNLYEEEDKTYGIQLIASDEFDSENDEWACSEIFSSEENLFYIDHSDEKDADWKRGLEFISSLVKEYLEKGSMANVLLSAKAVALGFVDGDLELIYSK